jgi:hypothetical protein
MTPIHPTYRIIASELVFVTPQLTAMFNLNRSSDRIEFSQRPLMRVFDALPIERADQQQ